MKKPFYLVVAGLLAVGTIGCQKKEEKKDGDKKEEAKKEDEAPEAPAFKAITKEFDDRTVEVTDLKWGAKLDVGSAEEGQEVVLVKIKLTNKVDKELNGNPLYFELKDNGGGKVERISVYKVDGKWELKKLKKGESNEGYIAFSAAKGADLSLVYQMDALGEKKEEIALK